MFRIRVIDSDGMPLSDVKIKRSVWTNEKDYQHNRDISTDANGVAEIALPKSMRTLRVWLAKDGYASLFSNWGMDEIEELPRNVDVTMVRPTTVGGKIVSQDGEPIVGVQVSVSTRSGGLNVNPELPIRYTAGGSARTDDQGQWTFSGAPPGDDVILSLKIVHPDFISDQYDGDLQRRSGVTTKQLRDQTAKIVMTRGINAYGQIIDANGSAIPGATITWSRDQSWSVWDSNRTKADAGGKFRLPTMTAGKLFIAVAADGWKPQRTEIELVHASRHVEIVMEPGNSLRLQVVDVAGKPIPNTIVTIERWGDVRSPIIGGQCKLFDGICPKQADENGIYQWKSAPDDAVFIRLRRRDYSSEQAELVAGNEIHTITLHPSVVISGTVVDDATGQPVHDAHMVPVTHSPQRPDDPIVQRSQISVLSDGEYLRTGVSVGNREELILQFEAMGYRPQRIGPFNSLSGKVNLDVRLKRASPLIGQVVDTDGQPVVGAVVSFTTKDTSLIVSDWSHKSDGLSTRTDDQGNFQFIATMNPPVIVATHEHGYVEVALELDQQPGILKLRPWARVEGRLLQDGKPVVGNRIRLSPIRMLGGDNPHLQDSFWTQTDLAGRFHFDRVPPVPSFLAPYLSVWEQCQLTSSRHVPLDLKPGETHVANIGEQGCIVRGRVKPAGEIASKLDMSYCLNYLLKLAPGITPPQPIARAGFDWQKGWSFDMRDSQEGRGFLATMHHHFVKFDAKGNFAIHGVTEGDYQFATSIYEPPEGCLVDPVGLDVISVKVDSNDLEKGEIDLGVIKVDISLGPQVGEPFPEFRYENIQLNEVQQVSELRGRYALVDFWATWCGPCVKSIPDLAKVAKRLDSDRAVVLSISLDEKSDLVREFIKDHHMDWQQGLLSQSDCPIVRKQLGISSVPVYYVLDPQGKLLHRSFRLDQAAESLEKALSESGK